MSILHGAATMGRSAAKARFTETFNLVREGYEPDQNGIDIPTETTVLTGIPGRLKTATTGVSNEETGRQLVAVQSPEVHVAVCAAPGARVGDFWVCTGSSIDDSLVGRKVRISGLPSSGAVTAHRYPVTEVS